MFACFHRICLPICLPACLFACQLAAMNLQARMPGMRWRWSRLHWARIEARQPSVAEITCVGGDPMEQCHTNPHLCFSLSLYIYIYINPRIGYYDNNSPSIFLCNFGRQLPHNYGIAKTLINSPRILLRNWQLQRPQTPCWAMRNLRSQEIILRIFFCEIDYAELSQWPLK